MRYYCHMLDEIFDEVLTKKGFDCVVKKWIKTLETTTQDKVEAIYQMEHIKPQSVDLQALYGKLKDNTELPFKLTSFRQHFRDRCACRTQ